MRGVIYMRLAWRGVTCHVVRRRTHLDRASNRGCERVCERGVLREGLREGVIEGWSRVRGHMKVLPYHTWCKLSLYPSLRYSVSSPGPCAGPGPGPGPLAPVV